VLGRARLDVYTAARQVPTVGPTVDDYRTGDKQVVVVLPGVYETWHFLRPLMDALHERGHPVCGRRAQQHGPCDRRAEFVIRE
jgi:hypothetical protein